MLGDNLRLTSHMTVSGCFLIDRVTQLQTVFNGFRTKVEKLIDLSGYLAVAHIYMAAPVGIYIYIDGTRHTDGVRYLYQHFIRHTGSYQVPVRTLTDGITKDIMMIEEIIGTGEIAISDHRSSQPTFEEFARLAADTRLGGVLSGKAGVINVHLGDGARCMELIERVISETEIPASQFLPTHVNRNEKLFQKAIEYAVKGGAVDFTGNEEIDYWETVCDEVRVCKGIRRMLDAGVNPKHITISSDGQGSLPIFNEKGEFLRMGMGQSSCLLKEVKECVEKAGIPLETAISTITANPAEILSLKGKGKIREGYDADLCVLDQGLEIQEVVARGKSVYRK